MLDPHIGDLAERYAVGDLDANEVAALEEHIATCAACMRLVGEAEETVLALERGYTVAIPPAGERLRLPVERRAIPFTGWASAVAAGLVIGILASWLTLSLHTNDTQTALVAMVNSHFNHAQFAPVSGERAAPAKVIYARDKSWLFVVATGSEHYGVYAVDAQGATHLGDLQPEGTSSTLYIDHRITQSAIELRDGARVLERAALR